MSQLDVYAVGQALVDEEYLVSDRFLSSLGVAKGHRTLIDYDRSRTLRQAATADGQLLKRMNGGSGANSITATAQLGASCHFSCRLGDDDEGDFYIRQLTESGVETDPRDRVAGGHTGVCLVMVTPDAERTMNTYVGITDDIGIDDVNFNALDAANWLYLEGHLLISELGHEAAIACRDRARRQGKKIAVNFCDPAVARLCRDEMTDLLSERCDLLFCNEEEAQIWTHRTDLEDAMNALDRLAKTWVLTRGEAGAIAYDGHNRFEIPAHKVNAVNTTGAGDTFAGAFLYGLTQGRSYTTAGSLASLASAVKVQHAGARLDKAQLLDVRRRILGA